MSREFRDRYRDIIEAVDELHPGFWTALADEVQRMREERITTRGAVVREFPAQEEAGIQAVVTAQDASIETAVETRREAAVQTGQSDSEPEPDSTSADDGESPIIESPWDSPREPRASPAALQWPVPPIGPPSPSDLDLDGCWNCGSRNHFARECPRGRTGDFCFRCDTRGCTVRTCPHCRSGWLAQGPYIRGRGHRGPDPMRDRRARDGPRPGPY